MEVQDLIKTLPEELMQIIIHSTSLQAVASIWMSNKYWHAKLRSLMAHPKIVFLTHVNYNIVTTVFMLNNGIVHCFRSSHKSSTILAVKYGWLKDVEELKDFLAKFNQIMKADDKMTGTENLNPAKFFLKIRYKEPKESYNNISNVIHEPTFNQLTELVEKYGYTENRPDTLSGITIDINYKPNLLMSRIFINSEGGIDITTRLKTTLSFRRHFTSYGSKKIKEFHKTITVQMRTSPAIFKQLEEAIVYSKHTKSLPELNDNNFTCVNSFDVRYVMNDKKYFVQEYGVQEGNQLALKTNGCKNGSIKKILHILDAVLFDKTVEYPIYEGQVTPAPHTFTGHQLIRLPRFKLPVDEDLPSVIAVELTSHNLVHYTLHLNSNVPLKEIVALFREVEHNLDPTATAYCELSINVPPNQKVIRLSVYSLKSFKPITRLPKEMVVKVWNMLVRTGCIVNSDYFG